MIEPDRRPSRNSIREARKEATIVLVSVFGVFVILIIIAAIVRGG